MTNTYELLLSESLQTILEYFIEETEALIGSMQTHLEALQKELHQPKIRTVTILELVRGAKQLNQYQVTRMSFLNEHKSHLLDKDKMLSDEADMSNLELLEAFVHESRHAVVPIQGCVGLLQTSDADKWGQIFTIFDRVLYMLTIMCEQVQEWQK